MAMVGCSQRSTRRLPPTTIGIMEPNTITVVLAVDPDDFDPNHETGLTEAAYEQLMGDLSYDVVSITKGG